MLQRARKTEKGAIFAVTAAFLPLALMLAMLVVDLGIAYSVRSRVEYVAIEAAEAAAVRLPDSTAAEELAENLASDLLIQTRGYTGNQNISATSDGSTVKVSITVDANTFFSKIMGVASIKVAETATRPIL